MILLYHVTPGHRLLPLGQLEDLPACGKPAVLLTRPHVLRAGQVPVRDVVKLNGKPAELGEPLICGSCAAPVRVDWLSDRQPFVRVPFENRSELKERWDRAI